MPPESPVPPAKKAPPPPPPQPRAPIKAPPSPAKPAAQADAAEVKSTPQKIRKVDHSPGTRDASILPDDQLREMREKLRQPVFVGMNREAQEVLVGKTVEFIFHTAARNRHAARHALEALLQIRAMQSVSIHPTRLLARTLQSLAGHAEAKTLMTEMQAEQVVSTLAASFDEYTSVPAFDTLYRLSPFAPAATIAELASWCGIEAALTNN